MVTSLHISSRGTFFSLAVLAAIPFFSTSWRRDVKSRRQSCCTAVGAIGGPPIAGPAGPIGCGFDGHGACCGWGWACGAALAGQGACCGCACGALDGQPACACGG